MFFFFFFLHFCVLSSFAIRLDVEEKADCFALIVFLMSCFCKCSVVLPRGAECWSAMCVIVIFPDHTHFLVTCGAAA